MRNYRTLFKVLVVLGLFGSLVFARDLNASRSASKVYSPAANGPALSTLNINNIQVWVGRAADMPASGANGASGDYPKGTTNMIFAEGLVWGVRIHDGIEPELRVNGATYTTGMKAGKVLIDGSGKATGATDPNDHHVWRVRNDWESADLNDDAAYANQHLPGEQSAGEVAAVYAQYKYDWENWPADMGAPYEDLDGDGNYTPAIWDAEDNKWINGDVPGFPGASQTLWVVANDVPYADGREVAPTSYGSPGGGFEEQLTVWGYNFPASEPLGNIQFKRARMIYTGRPDGASDSYIDTAYFSQWSDPDLGTYTDDLVGFDTTLSLGYVYNGNTLDATYNGQYSMPVPAGGYDFLQGPKVDGVPLGMTTNGWFGAGAPDSDPDLGEYSGTLQWFNLMEGYRPRPEYPDREPWFTNDSGVETKFPLAGNPVTGVGDIDGVNLTPGDRRMLSNSGPFSMALGDTQDVVIALIGAVGGDNLSSITVLKYYDISAQFAYDNNFDLPAPPTKPKVEVVANDGSIILQWGNDANAVSATEDKVQKGFEFQGYKIYQLPNSSASAGDGELIGIFDKTDGVITITEKVVDAQSGLVLDLPRHIGSDSGIKRYMYLDNDEIRNRPFSNDIPYYFGVSAYSYLEDHELSPFKSLESSLAIVEVRPQMAAPGVSVPTAFGDVLDVTHVKGTAGGVVSATIIDPMVLTGHDYKVWYDQQHYYLDVDGVWKPTAFPDKVGKSASKLLDCTGSSITVAALASANVGTFDLTFTYDMVCGSNWVDGIMLDFPDNFVVNSWDALGEDVAGGQNCNNMAGTLDPATNSLIWGNDARSGWGCITGNLVFTVNVNAVDMPFDIDYVVYDDGYDATIVDATGIAAASELGYSFQTIDQWNLFDVTAGKDIITGQTIFGGVEYTPEHPAGMTVGTDASPVTDGFQLNVDVGFAAPTDWASYTHTRPDGSTDVFSPGRAVAWLNFDQHGKPFILTSYGMQGWAASSRAIDAQGFGATSVNLLQRDYEVRYTGVYGDPIGNYIPVVEGGSMAVIDGSRVYDFATHPDPNSPGDGSPFQIRVPFEVWDMEADGGPAQVGMIIYDRLQDTGSAEFYAFNPSDRMYTHFSVIPYDEFTAMDPLAASESNLLTWNLVWWNADWTQGDVVHFVYDNPIQHGSDEWALSTAAITTGGEITDDMVDMINVFPNPYYGYHDLETARRSKYVRFNHLPQKAEIRIFSTGGVMVRKMDKDDASQNIDWDLKNQYGYPVASGIYIAHVDLPDVGKEKVLKIALVQEEQILLSY